MFDNEFRKRYKKIPVAIHKIVPAESVPEKKELTFLHFHDEIEMMCIEEGEATIYIDGADYDVKAGDSVMISPCRFHRGDIHSGSFSYYCICFDAEIFGESYLKRLIINSDKQLTCVVSDEEIKENIINICELYENEEKGWELGVISSLYKIFSLVEKNNWLCGIRQTNSNAFCENAVSYIKENYKDNITSKSCAENMYITQSCLCRKFRQYFGESFSEYLNLFRLSKAKALLESGGHTVTEAGTEAGFNSTSYFIMQFKKVYGKTPKQLYK